MPTFTTTTKHALRWLTGANPGSDIDAGFQALAEDIDAKLTPYDRGALGSRPPSSPGTQGKTGRRYSASDTGQEFSDFGTGWTDLMVRPARVTTLPTTNLYDGQMVWYAADSTAGVVWALRYNAGTAKWESLGGAPVSIVDTAQYSTASLTYVGAGSTSITLTYAGDYVFTVAAGVAQTVTSPGEFMAVAVGINDAVPSSLLEAGVPAPASAGVGMHVSIAAVPYTVTAGAVIRPMFKTSLAANIAYIRFLKLTAIPVKIG